MFTLDLIFISITFLILSYFSMKIGSPKVIIPLSIIFIFFIIRNLPNSADSNFSELPETNKNKINQPTRDAVFNSLIEDTLINKIESGATKKDNIVKVQENSQPKKSAIKKEKIAKKEKIVKKETIAKKEKNSQKNRKTDQKKASNDKDKNQFLSSVLTLKEINICKNIKNRNPVGIGEVFSNSVDSLYCYTKIENRGKKMEIRHVWYYENQVMTQVRYNVKKSNVYRSWTKKTISSFQVGNWRVEVQDRNGTIIGSKRFKIKKS